MSIKLKLQNSVGKTFSNESGVKQVFAAKLTKWLNAISR